jgi:hypothetical protein
MDAERNAVATIDKTHGQMGCTGMQVSIADGLVPDSINVISHDRFHIPRVSNEREGDLHRLWCCTSFGCTLKRLSKLVSRLDWVTQRIQGRSSLLGRSSEPLRELFQSLAHLRNIVVSRQRAFSEKLAGFYGLQKGIVQVSGKSRSFREALIERIVDTQDGLPLSPQQCQQEQDCG